MWSGWSHVNSLGDVRFRGRDGNTWRKAGGILQSRWHWDSGGSPWCCWQVKTFIHINMPWAKKTSYGFKFKVQIHTQGWSLWSTGTDVQPGATWGAEGASECCGRWLHVGISLCWTPGILLHVTFLDSVFQHIFLWWCRVASARKILELENRGGWSS